MVKALALLTLLSLFCSTAWSADPPLTLYDEGVKQGVVFKIDCTGAGVACTRTGTTATVDVDAGGPGGSPGGSSPQIQFNDGGSFGGVSGSGADANGNIGIGTHTPSTKLQVVGTISATNFSGSSSGTNTGDQDISVKQNIASLETDVEAIVDLQDLQGAVTDSQVPNNITVDLASTVTTNANLTGDVTSVGNATTLNSDYKGWTDVGTNVYTSTTTDKVGIGTTTPTSGMKLDVRGSQYVSGNVGVGTTIPSANLMAVGSTVNVFKLVSTTASASNGGAGIQSWNDDGAAVVSGDRLAFYTFGGSYNGTNGLGSGGAISGFADGTYSASSYPTDIRIETAPSGSTTRTARVYVKSTGNVGIGSATPGQALDVQGTVRATAFSGDGSALTGISGGSSGWTDGGANVYTTTTTDNVGIGTTTPSTTLEIIETSNRHPIMVSSTPTGDGDIFILTNDGNVGIGTTSPNEFVTLKGSTTGTVSIKTWNTNSSGLAGVKVHNSDNKGFEMVATGSGYAVPSTYGVLATAGENLSFGESDGTINLRVNSGGTIRFTPTDTPDTCDAGTEGSLYYDNSLNEFCDCDGSSWAQIDGGGAC